MLPWLTVSRLEVDCNSPYPIIKDVAMGFYVAFILIKF